MTTEKPSALPLEGTVTAVSHKDGVPTGIKLDDGEWKNYSKPEWRDGTWYEPNKGDRVRIMVSQGKWIRSIERLNGAQQDFEQGQVPTAGGALATTRRTALMTAGTIVAALIQQNAVAYLDPEHPVSQVGIDVLALAQDWERWVNREEVPWEYE